MSYVERPRYTEQSTNRGRAAETPSEVAPKPSRQTARGALYEFLARQAGRQLRRRTRPRRPWWAARACDQVEVAAREVRPVALNARLTAAGPAHSGVRVSGLGRFVPAHTVHDCALQAVDHYHVYRARVSMRPLLESGPARQALRALLDNPDGSSAVSAFQQALKPLRTPPRPGHDARVSVAVSVQQCDGSRRSANTHYVVEESVLSLVDLLARDADLVRSFARALAEPQPGGHTAEFLRGALRAAGRSGDLDLLTGAAGLPAQADASIFAFFGSSVVDNATAIMIGTGNRLDPGTGLHRPDASHGDLRADLGWLRYSTGLTGETGE